VQIVPKTLSQKYPTQNRVGGVSQVVECLSTKHESLSSNPSTGKKKKERILKAKMVTYNFLFQINGISLLKNEDYS
jgi:hypothetical protein